MEIKENHIKKLNFSLEWVFNTSRSGGSGGQHVNKVSTKVELRFDIINSLLLTEEQKQCMVEKLYNYVTKQGILQIVSDTERSQLANKKLVIERFYKLLEVAFKVQPKRIPTKQTKRAKENILKEKKIQAEKKKRRNIDPLDLQF